MSLVCFDVQLNIVGQTQNETTTILKNSATARWKLGACSSLNSIEGNPTYQYPALYTERCCLESGVHTLLCYNIPPARGWMNSYLVINGHRYCDDFLTYKSYQTIMLKGKNWCSKFNRRYIAANTSKTSALSSIVLEIKPISSTRTEDIYPEHSTGGLTNMYSGTFEVMAPTISSLQPATENTTGN